MIAKLLIRLCFNPLTMAAESTEIPSIFDLPENPTFTVETHDESTCSDPTHGHGPDDFNGEGFWSDDFKKSLPLAVLGALVADEMFGDKMDSKNEDLFLAGMLDETQPLQSELVAKIGAMFEANGFYLPDRLSLQIFKRKAGFRQKRGDADMGSYSVALCLRDFQVVVFNKQEQLVTNGNTTSFFELEPHPEGSGRNAKFSPRPSVPYNRTTVKLPNGKALLKSREYLCILVWGFWNEHPIKPQEETPGAEMNGAFLQKMVDDLKAQGQTQQAEEIEKILGSKREDGLTIYDSLAEAEAEKSVEPGL